MSIDLDPTKLLIADIHFKGVTQQDAVTVLEILLERGNIAAPGMAILTHLVEDYYQLHPITAEENKQLPIAKDDDRLLPAQPEDGDTSARVRQWCEKADGEFHHEEVFQEMGLLSDHRSAARAALQRMAGKRDLIERVGKKRGYYRRIDDNLQAVDYLNATGKEYPIVLPFNLHNWVKIYSKAIIVLAGSSNAGKSAFCLNVVRDNMKTHRIRYFTSEFSADDLKIRLENFGIDLKDWIWEVYERNRDFHDVVNPEGLNIIDYMDVPEGVQPYEMNRPIDKIFQRLTTGIALIAIQKRPGKDAGVGGETTIERARLAINMDRADVSKGEEYNTLTIRKAKSPRYHLYNPNGWQWQYKLSHGTTFKVVESTDAQLAERELRKYNYWEGK